MSATSSRKIVVSFILSFSLAGVMSLALGRNTLQAQQAAASKLDTTATPCLFDFERGEIPNCVRLSADGDSFIVPHFVRQLHFDSYGLAPVFSLRNGWMYVNRKGKAVVRGVPTVDNWPDSFHDGLVRVLSHRKYGFANRKGQVVIPPTYDGAMNFHNGKAKVCKGCESRCSGDDCEHHFFAAGEWFQIDTQGTTVSRIQP